MMWSLGTGAVVVSATAEALLKKEASPPHGDGDRKAWRFRLEGPPSHCFANERARPSPPAGEGVGRRLTDEGSRRTIRLRARRRRCLSTPRPPRARRPPGFG